LSSTARKSIKQLKSEIFSILNLEEVRSIVLDPNAGCFYDLSTTIFSKHKIPSAELNRIGQTNDEYFPKKIIPIQLGTLDSSIFIEVE